MPGENLTHFEAQHRAKNITACTYQIYLDLTRGKKVFRSRTVLTFAATPGTGTFIDLIADKVHEITLNGRILDPSKVFVASRILLSDLMAENELVVDADCLYTNTGQGLHRFVDTVDGEVYLYSQFEVPDSRRVFAVFEQPDLKAIFQFTVTAPAAWKVISNTLVLESVVNGDDTVGWVFASTPPISSYITALIAGPYEAAFSELISASGRVIPLGVYGRKSLWRFLDPDDIFQITRKGFAYFESKFGVPYAFDKYDQLFVPEFNAGAMENAGAVTFAETNVFRSKVTDAVKERRVVTILHELAHMWFGNLVTMKWWNDLWLNESFAEWASTIATAEAAERPKAWVTFNAMEKAWAYRQDQLPSTHPIVAEINDLEDVQVNFDGITYAKGGSVLKQLAAWVGIEAFFAGVSQYFQKYSWGNTELGDLLSELEATSGRDLSNWSKRWLETAGVNTLRPEIAVDSLDVITRFSIIQNAPLSHPTLRPHRLRVGFYNIDGGILRRVSSAEVDVDNDRTEVPQLVGLPRPNLVLLNDDDLTYAKIRFDDVSLSTAITHLANIEDPLARTLVWGSLWDQTRDAEAAPSTYIDLVLRNISRETESTTLHATLEQLRVATEMYITPECQLEVRENVAAALWKHTLNAPAGSDSQLEFLLAFAAMTTTQAQAELIRQLRDGETTLEGLVIDTDLSWQLLIALTAAGFSTSQSIDDALAADNTATGAEFAAQARAAVPTLQSKQATWDQLVNSDLLPNTIVRAMVSGFSNPATRHLMDGFVEPYFEMLLPIWESRAFKIAELLITGLYPESLATASVRDQTQAWLDSHPQAPPALRRMVAENLAGVTRALAAQQRDSVNLKPPVVPVGTRKRIMKAQITTSATFEQDVLQAEGPVLVDFWAPWCGPCRQVSPVLDQIQAEHLGKITILKLDIDANPDVAEDYQITSIPALKLFINGEVATTIIGAKPKFDLERDLAEYLPQSSAPNSEA